MWKEILESNGRIMTWSLSIVMEFYFLLYINTTLLHLKFGFDTFSHLMDRKLSLIDQKHGLFRQFTLDNIFDNLICFRYWFLRFYVCKQEVVLSG